MAENNENNCSFYQFRVRPKGDKEKKFQNLKIVYPLSELLKILEIDDDETEEEIVTKIVNKIANERLAYLEAANAVAEEGKDLKRQEIYKEKLGRDDGIFSSFFAASDYWDEEAQRQYAEYRKKCAEIAKKESEDPEERNRELVELEKNNSEVLNKKNQYDSTRALQQDYLELSDLASMNERGLFFNISLIKTYKETRSDTELSKAFDKLYMEYAKDERFKVSVNADGQLENTHRFSVSEIGKEKTRVLQHVIENLGGSGLTLTMLGDNISISYNSNPMTENQLKALAQYCFHHNLNISDYFSLNDVNVVDKDGEEIGSVKDQFQAKTKELEDNNGEYVFNLDKPNPNQDEYGKELDSLNGYDVVRADILDQIKEGGDLNVTRSKMIDGAKKRLVTMGYRDPKLTKISYGFNETIISVYDSYADMRNDGKYKDDIKQSTKAFAVKLQHTNPPKASMYIEQKKEFKTNHARVMLQAFKNCGCEYYIVPNALEMGGKNIAAFMEASGKTLMVPVCKRSSSKNDKGIILDTDNVAMILETIKKENKKDANAVINFKLKLLRELNAQEKHLREEAEAKGKTYQTNSTLSTLMATIEGGVKFQKFQSSYLGQLQKYVNDGLAGKYGKKWDGVDRAAACKAMTRIAEDITNGTLNGEAYSLTDKSGQNVEKLKQAMARYMAEEKPEVVKQINEKLGELNVDKNVESKISKASNEIFRAYEKEMNNMYTNHLKEEWGVENLKPVFNDATVGYTPNSYANSIPLTPHEDEDKNQIAAYAAAHPSRDIAPEEKERAEEQKNKNQNEWLAYANSGGALDYLEWKKQKEQKRRQATMTNER